MALVSKTGSPDPRGWVLVGVLLSGCAATAVRDEQAIADNRASWHADALSVAAGSDSAGRADAIVGRLEVLGLAVQRQPFTSPAGPGVNLIAALPDVRDLPVLMIGAHYDRVALGQGAVDNASGCATVLALGAAFLRQPLAHHRVVLAFWDQEELGLLGSKAYVAGHAAPALYLNFDVFGYGDTIWGMVPTSDARFGEALGDAGEAGKVATSIGLAYPPSDHLAFLEGKRRAVSLSLVGGAEIPHILEAFAGRRPTVMPRVMELIHTAHDLPSELDPIAVARALPVVVEGVRRWDVASADAPR